MLSRREFSTAMLAGAGALVLPGRSTVFGQTPAAPTVVNGVRLGLITYNFRSMPRVAGVDYIDTVVDACLAAGGGDIEVMARLTVQPQQGSREDMRQWRLNTPLSFFSNIKDRFAAKGMRVIWYSHTFSDDMTDAELDKMMQHAKAMGANIMGLTMCRIDAAARLAPLAQRNDLVVTFHNRPEPDRGEVSTPESFDAMLQVSDRFRINLDMGHFTAGNHDVLAALEKFHTRISHVHLKDRKRGTNGGANMPWGQGDTPLVEALRMIRDRKWPMPAIAEYEYQGTGTPIEESARCLAYARQALQS